MRIAIIGASGFVGSSLKDRASAFGSGLDIVEVNRSTYDEAKSGTYDMVVNASNNSKKYISDREPLTDFDLSVEQQMRVLHDFPAPYQVLLSSVDVYSDLDSFEGTKEGLEPDLGKVSHYGFHKYLAEQCVRHYADKWMIIRLAGMVGPGLKKNPVFDITNGQPLRIHPDSQYQFMHTSDVARDMWTVLREQTPGQIVNLTSEGLITPRRVAELAGREIDLSQLPAEAQPRNVRINIDKLKTMLPVTTSESAVKQYLNEIQA